VLKEVKELAGVTFRPDLSPSRQRAGESFVVRACAGVPRGKARLWLVICMLCQHARAYNHFPQGSATTPATNQQQAGVLLGAVAA
jgi:hypothetical protein